MTFTGELRPYQKAASRLIVDRGRCLLALDLGTGKTITAIHAIEELREKGKIETALLIMSSSLTFQWANRIVEFTDVPSDKIKVIDGSLTPAKRRKALQEALESRPAYVVMGIRQVVAEPQFVEQLKPGLILVDEVTSIKNFKPQQSKVIKKHCRSPYRVGLTAEPIENGKAEELYSIMQWIDPDLYGDWRDFEDRYIERNAFNIITSYKNVKEMHEILMTACINKRRDDKEVAEFMPTVEEYNVYVEMDDATRILYGEIGRELLQVLRDAGPRANFDLSKLYEGGNPSDSDSGLGRITSRFLAGALLLDSPELLRASGMAYGDPSDRTGSKYAAGLLGRIPEGLGAKLEACEELVREYLEQDPKHKIIVFARFKGILPLLEKCLNEYEVVQFHGGLNGKQRAEAIDKFTNSARVFLSSDAGGAGVDLYMASHLINYDLPLSAGMFKQRNGRHVRASSLFRNVTIDNLIVSATIEEYQLQRLRHKAHVADAVLTGRGTVRGSVSNDVESLTKFLERSLNGNQDM